MTPRVGSWVWVPCEVRPGPFRNERMVRVRGAGAEWLGFVSTALLREPIEKGETSVKALVVDSKGERILAQILGAPVMASLVEEEAAKVQPA